MMDDRSPGDDPLQERSFYVRAKAPGDPDDSISLIVKTPDENALRELLNAEGYTLLHVIESVKPEGWPARLDGTVFAASAAHPSHHDLKVFGPFEDQREAQEWVLERRAEQVGRKVTSMAGFTVIEPTECIRIEEREGKFQIVRFPQELFDSQAISEGVGEERNRNESDPANLKIVSPKES